MPSAQLTPVRVSLTDEGKDQLIIALLTSTYLRDHYPEHDGEHFKLLLTDESRDQLIIDLLKSSYLKNNYPRYDEGGESIDGHVELLDAILKVLEWYMPHAEYVEFVAKNPEVSS